MLLTLGTTNPQAAGLFALAVIILPLAMIVFVFWHAWRAASGKRVVRKSHNHFVRYGISLIGAVLMITGEFFFGNVVAICGLAMFIWGVRPLVLSSWWRHVWIHK